MKNIKRGFTLIELLVVIAIIGILSAVVLASLNTARDKGADAAIKGDLDGIRAQAQIVYEDNSNDYTNVCIDQTVIAAVTGALTAGTDLGALADRCHSDTDHWNAWATLKTDTAQMWCVDNTGTSRQGPVASAPTDPLTPCP